jgi:hypothetical protein
MTETNKLSDDLKADEQFRQCFGCNFDAVTGEKVCPKCGSTTFLTAANIRSRGTIMMTVGFLLAGLIGGVAIFVWVTILKSDNPRTISRVNDDMAAFYVVYLLFGGVILFGVHSIVSGIWMRANGKRSRSLVRAMWILLFAIMVIASFARVFTDS